MAQGIIQQARPAKSGRTLSVQINGAWYSTKHFELQNMVGQEITFQSSPGKPPYESITWLNDYTIAGASTNTADQAFDAAYAQHKAEQGGGQNMSTPKPQMDTQASIVAQALTKSCTAPGDDPQKVWERYQFFYGKAKAWDGTVERPANKGDYPEPDEFGDEIPFD